MRIIDGQQDPNPSDARTDLSEPLLLTLDTTAPDAPTPDLLAFSDSGVYDDDDVTNISAAAFGSTAAFVNTAEANAKITVSASPVDPATGTASGTYTLIGSGTVGSDSSDFAPGDGMGRWEITVEPLDDGVWSISTNVEDLAGNISLASDLLRIVVDTEAPNTPYLDLQDDTGRHDDDLITADNTPQVSMTTTDPNLELAQVLYVDNFWFRLYDRTEDLIEQLIYDSSLDTAVEGLSVAGDTFTSLSYIQEILPEQLGGVLADGLHNLKLEVEDRAGNISADFLLQITVDTVDPPVSFGLPDVASTVDGLAASSDTGVTTMPSTYADRATSDTTPLFWGRAEADAIVQLYLDRNDNGVIDIGIDNFLGQTVALPYDGNDAYPDGYWEINSALDLNQLVGLPKDGLRSLLVTAEDVAGNPLDVAAAEVDQLDIFLDTQGPQIADVTVPDAPDYDLFDPKPSETGPTPLVYSLTVDFVDQPNRVSPDFLYEALVGGIATNPGNYLLVGDHVGTIAIETVSGVILPGTDGEPATTSLTISFVDPLPDDRFTLTISDNLVDPVGNQLDGESNAVEPLDDPTFPSGDGVPGGDFVARFTVDSRPEIGSYVSEGINLDINGNFVWDPATGEIGDDATNVDLTFTLPVADPGDGSIDLGGFNVHDLLFAGKFAPLGGLIVGDDAVFIIDVSGSTSSSFGGDPVGDQNGDGLFNTVLDAEIAAFIALNQELIDRGLGNTSQVSVVAFQSSATSRDMDPIAAGVQLTTTPLADANSNGIRDVDEVLQSLYDGGGTDYEDALAEASTTVAAIGTPNTNVIFLSDGVPNIPGAHADEVATLLAQGVNLRAFGVGPGVSLTELLIIDPAAETFSNTNELLDVFSGGGQVPGGALSGFDQLAAYGNSAELGGFRWIIDTNSDGVVNTADGDILTMQPLQNGFDVMGAIPLAGNFDGDPDNGDEIVLYNLGTWVLDTDRDFVVETNGDDTVVNGTLYGHPIIGDFDGDGLDDLGVFNNNVFRFDLANDGFGADDADGDLDDTFVWGFPGVLDRPVAADMDQDGIDDIGLWVPRDSAQLPQGVAEWYFLLSNDFDQTARVTGTVDTLDHPYEPVPFGNDLYAEFGDELSLPIVGNFDPPVADSGVPDPGGQTIVENADFDNDGDVDGRDFMAWQRGHGMAPPADEAGTTDGDADRDGDVDTDDLWVWQGTYGSTAASQALTSPTADEVVVVASTASVESESVMTEPVLAEPVTVAAYEPIDQMALALASGLDAGFTTGRGPSRRSRRSLRRLGRSGRQHRRSGPAAESPASGRR